MKCPYTYYGGSMSAIYPKYRIVCLLLSLAYGIPWAVVHALRGEYGEAVVLPVFATLLLCIFADILAARKYDRLVRRIYTEQCDGEAFAREYAKIDANRCKAPAQQAVLLTNGAIAAYERGDDQGAFLIAEEALLRIDGKKGIPPVTAAAVYLNCGAYAIPLGKLAQAEEMLGRISALRETLKPNQPIVWLKTVEDYEERLSYDIRYRNGDCGDELLSYFLKNAESAEQNSTRLSYRYELGCLYLLRGEYDGARREFECVIRDGNTLRVTRMAREKLAEMNALQNKI